MPRGSGRDPRACPCLRLHTVPPLPPRWDRWRFISSCRRDPHLHRQLKTERNPGLHPRGKSQINTGSLATKPHRGEVQTPQPGWFAGTLGLNIEFFCSLRVGSTFPAGTAISPCCGISTARAGVSRELVAEKLSLDPAGHSDWNHSH